MAVPAAPAGIPRAEVGTFASLWWSCIPIALVRYALLARVKEPPR
jgi:hypothetical protein